MVVAIGFDLAVEIYLKGFWKIALSPYWLKDWENLQNRLDPPAHILEDVLKILKAI